MVAKRSEDRYESMTDCLADLRKCQAVMAPATLPPGDSGRVAPSMKTAPIDETQIDEEPKKRKKKKEKKRDLAVWVYPVATLAIVVLVGLIGYMVYEMTRDRGGSVPTMVDNPGTQPVVTVTPTQPAPKVQSPPKKDPTPAVGPWVVYDGFNGPGKGKHIVLVSGEDEFRSEEAIPQLGKILAKNHGFKCTVLFAIENNGIINPAKNDNIPGLEALKSANLIIMFIRQRNLPDAQMKNIADYVDSGKPIIGLCTATHAFALQSKTYADYNWDSKGDWEGGFGRFILGETWIDYYGKNGAQSTRGIISRTAAQHPILRGIQDGDIWGPSCAYAVRQPLPFCTPIVLGQVLDGMSPASPPAAGKANVPIAWTKTYRGKEGGSGRVFTTTMGAAQDLQSEGFRRLLANACFWALGMEDKAPGRANVDIVGEYKPSTAGKGSFRKGVKPADHALK
jgi:type 1 glutamine amidotransferase